MLCYLKWLAQKEGQGVMGEESLSAFSCLPLHLSIRRVWGVLLVCANVHSPPQAIWGYLEQLSARWRNGYLNLPISASWVSLTQCSLTNLNCCCFFSACVSLLSARLTSNNLSVDWEEIIHIILVWLTDKFIGWTLRARWSLFDKASRICIIKLCKHSG